MRPADLLARVAEHGYRVRLTPDGPQLVRELGGGTLPGQLLSALKEHREAVVRHLLVAAALARAGETNRPVWGLTAGDPCPRRVAKGKVPDAWEFVCVEGDLAWQRLPIVTPPPPGPG